MKKKLVALAAAVATLALSAVMLAGCSGGGDAQSADSAATDGSFTLAVGFDQGYPPYGYVGDDGQFTGFDLELAKAVCEKMGWELKLEPIDWDAKDALIGSGTINCIWNGFTMENRENDYTFSEPYMYNEQVVVVKKDSDAKKLEDRSFCYRTGARSVCVSDGVRVYHCRVAVAVIELATILKIYEHMFVNL